MLKTAKIIEIPKGIIINFQNDKNISDILKNKKIIEIPKGISMNFLGAKYGFKKQVKQHN